MFKSVSVLLASSFIFCAATSVLAGTNQNSRFAHSYAIAKLPTVMPLGDSNTFGWNVNEGYREPLANLLIQDSFPVEYVGNETDSRSPWFTNNHHEGHSGWTAEELTIGRDGLFPMGSVSQYKPDVILLMAGTNDFLQKNFTVDRAEQNFVGLVNEVQKRSPNSIIIIATIFPIVNPTTEPRTPSLPYNDKVNEFNKRLLARYPHSLEGGGKIEIFDINPSMNYIWFDDGVHPNWSGYQVVGQAWHPVVASVVRDLYEGQSARP